VLEPDSPQYDRLAARVIAQQYSSANFFSPRLLKMFIFKYISFTLSQFRNSELGKYGSVLSLSGL